MELFLRALADKYHAPVIVPENFLGAGWKMYVHENDNIDSTVITFRNERMVYHEWIFHRYKTLNKNRYIDEEPIIVRDYAAEYKQAAFVIPQMIKIIQTELNYGKKVD